MPPAFATPWGGLFLAVTAPTVSLMAWPGLCESDLLFGATGVDFTA
ncbi:hypothetical protein [Anaerolinea thermolimosa]|nr:hypothetical protein [Anaerolinea thermolimosa]